MGGKNGTRKYGRQKKKSTHKRYTDRNVRATNKIRGARDTIKKVKESRIRKVATLTKLQESGIVTDLDKMEKLTRKLQKAMELLDTPIAKIRINIGTRHAPNYRMIGAAEVN